MTRMGGDVVERGQRTGVLGEEIAAAFLSLKGFTILERNYRYAHREIDIVARRGEHLVAVEVKLRRKNRFGKAIESVDERKVQRIRTALGGYIQTRGVGLRPRIDLVVIDFSADFGSMVVRHLEGIL